MEEGWGGGGGSGGEDRWRKGLAPTNVGNSDLQILHQNGFSFT